MNAASTQLAPILTNTTDTHLSKISGIQNKIYEIKYIYLLNPSKNHKVNVNIDKEMEKIVQKEFFCYSCSLQFNSKNVYDYLYGTFKSYFDLIGTPRMIQFHILNQAQIRQSSYQSDIIKTIVKNLNRDLKSDLKVKDFTEKYEFLLLSFMLVGAPPELFLATHTSNINLTSDQLATFLAKLFHKVLME